MPTREITTEQWAHVDLSSGALPRPALRRVRLLIALVAVLALVLPVAHYTGYVGDGENYPVGLAGTESFTIAVDARTHTFRYDLLLANSGWIDADVVGAESRVPFVATVSTTRVTIPAGESRRVSIVFRVTDCRQAPPGDIWPNVLIDRLWGTQRSMIDVVWFPTEDGLNGSPARLACGLSD